MSVFVARNRVDVLGLASKDPKAAPLIDLGLLKDPDDLETLAAGLERLLRLIAGGGSALDARQRFIPAQPSRGAH